MLAGGGAQGEQPFLQLLQPARVKILVAGKRLEGRHRIGDFGQCAIERADHRLQPSSRLVHDPHQCSLGGIQPALGAAFAGQFGEGAVHRLHHLFPVHHHRAGFGKLFLFARARFQLVQFGDGVAKILLLRPARPISAAASLRATSTCRHAR